MNRRLWNPRTVQDRNRIERPVRQVAYVAGLLGPFTALPQVATVWVFHQTSGVSLASEAGFTALAAIWLVYGAVLREGPIVLSSLLWVILDLAIVCGVLRYGHF